MKTDRNENCNLAKFIVYHCFRSQGLIEDLHAAGHISQEQMKQLNKTAVSRIAAILHIVYESEVAEILGDFIRAKDPFPEWDDTTYEADDDYCEVFTALAAHAVHEGCNADDFEFIRQEGILSGVPLTGLPFEISDDADKVEEAMKFLHSLTLPLSTRPPVELTDEALEAACRHIINQPLPNEPGGDHKED